MPLSIRLHPDIIPLNITHERLNSYKSVFQVASDHELVGAYLWNLHVCSQLYPILNFAEICIRNSVDQTITIAEGRFWWSQNTLRYKSKGNHGPKPDSVNNVTSNFSKAFNAAKRDKLERYNSVTPPSHDEVVAKTDFSTWESIFDEEFLGRGLFWPRLLGRVLKGGWPSTSGHTTTTNIRQNISIVRKFRNRLSHHEPIWKRFNVLDERDAVDHLNEKLDTLEELIRRFSPEAINLLRKNNLLSNARMACSLPEVNRFKYRNDIHNVKSISKIIKLIDSNPTVSSLRIKIYSNNKHQFLLTPVRY
ncbi:hypothetical protein H4S14_001233 [Agrobacterium vitis]|nr:hypothetical protein [Agrobacterium vitis]MBE1437502.1 hypothetical protein [Agrobacterium vitis]